MSYAAKAWYAGVVTLLTGLIASLGGPGVVAGISTQEFLGSLLAAVVAWGGTYGIENRYVRYTRETPNGNTTPRA